MDHTLNKTPDKMKCEKTFTKGDKTNKQKNNHQINKSLKSPIQANSVSLDIGYSGFQNLQVSY